MFAHFQNDQHVVIVVVVISNLSPSMALSKPCRLSFA